MVVYQLLISFIAFATLPTAYINTNVAVNIDAFNAFIFPCLAEGKIYQKRIAVSGLSDFKKHFDVWTQRETAFLDAVNSAIPLAMKADPKLYKKLCKLAHELKTEIMRAGGLKTRLPIPIGNRTTQSSSQNGSTSKPRRTRATGILT